MISVANESLKPKPKLDLVEWADTYRFLSSESAAEPGRWRTARVPYMREIMQASSSDSVSELTLMLSSQLGKTELLLNLIGYYIDQNPSPILLIQPTEFAASQFGKERVAGLLRDTPAISKLFDKKYKDSSDTLLYKGFPGGFLAMAGSNSPTALAGRPIKIILLDEVDRFPTSAKAEGDPVSIVKRRCQNFHDSKIVKVSTPTVEGASKINEEFLKSSQGYWNICCIHCDEYYHPLIDHIQQIDEYNTVLVCPHCGGFHNDNERLVASSKGKFIHNFPENPHKGFHANAIVSPWVKLAQIYREYNYAKDEPAKLQPVVNTLLGLPFANVGVSMGSSSDMLNRVEDYTTATIPNEVEILTCGIDVQLDRFEAEILGHNKTTNQTWNIDYIIFQADTSDISEFYKFREHLFSQEYIKVDGSRLVITNSFIDSGYQTKNVYEFCNKSKKFNITAIKGLPGSRAPLTLSKSKYGSTFFRVAVDVFKENIFNSLQITDKEKHGYCHFPAARDGEYFEQLCESETRTFSIDKRGQKSYIYVKKGKDIRNEALDTRVYALAAFSAIKNAHVRNATYLQALLNKPEEVPQNIAENTEKHPEKLPELPKTIEKTGKYSKWKK